jgi:hypothetical protein
MTVCSYCLQEMTDKVGCTVWKYDDFVDNISRSRFVSTEDCHDCGCPKGKLHHPGCDDEKCPKCLEQAIGCDCIEGEQ